MSGIKETGVDITGSSTACLYSTPAGNPFPTGCNVGEFWDFDLTGRYAITDHFQVYAYIANLFDRKPPLDPADYAGGANGFGLNYNPTYEQAGAIGRAFKIGAHYQF